MDKTAEISAPVPLDWSSNLPPLVIKRHLLRQIMRIAEHQVLRRVCKRWRQSVTLPHVTLQADSSRSIPSIVSSYLKLTMTSPTSQQFTALFEQMVKDSSSPLQVLSIEKIGAMDVDTIRHLSTALQAGINLMSLELSEGSLTEAAFSSLLEGLKSAKSKIISLKLSLPVPASIIPSICTYVTSKPLRRLVLENTTFSEEGLRALSQSLISPKCKLQGLTLQGTLASGASAIFEALRSNKTILHLEIGDKELNYASLFENLASNRNIKTLRLREGTVPATAFGDMLAENSSLQEVELDRTHLFYDYRDGDYGDLLGRMSSIKKLKIVGYSGDLFYRAICKTMQTNSSIEFLDFTHGFRFAADYIPIVDFLGVNDSLKDFSLDLSCIDIDTATKLAASFKKNVSIEKLFFKLDGKAFESGGSPLRVLKMLLEAVRSNPNIRSLRVEAPCEDDVVIVVANLIAGSQPVTQVCMPNSQIQTKGATRLFEAISRNQSLHTLDISYNEFATNEAFGEALVSAVINNQQLKSLVLRGTTLGPAVITSLVNALKANDTVALDVDLREVKMPDEVRRAVDKLVLEKQGAVRVIRDK